ADLVGGVVSALRQLPVVEDAEIVELLLDRAGHSGELLEIVRGTARPGKALEAGRSLWRGFLRGDRTGRGPDIDSGIALSARNAVDRGTRHQIAVKRDRTAGVVIARHNIGDTLRIRIGIDDRGDRNIQPLGFLN